MFLKHSPNDVKMETFRIMLVPKVARSSQSWPQRGPRHPHRVPRTTQEFPFGVKSGPRDPSRVPKWTLGVPLGRLWAPFGRLLGGFGCLWGSFWTPLGVSVTTFGVLRLNQGKPMFCLEKRTPGALGGDQAAGFCSVHGPKIRPKSTTWPQNVHKDKPRVSEASA